MCQECVVTGVAVATSSVFWLTWLIHFIRGKHKKG